MPDSHVLPSLQAQAASTLDAAIGCQDENDAADQRQEIEESLGKEVSRPGSNRRSSCDNNGEPRISPAQSPRTYLIQTRGTLGPSVRHRPTACVASVLTRGLFTESERRHGRTHPLIRRTIPMRVPAPGRRRRRSTVSAYVRKEDSPGADPFGTSARRPSACDSNATRLAPQSQARDGRPRSAGPDEGCGRQVVLPRLEHCSRRRGSG